MPTRNFYRFTMTAICPVNPDRRDFYDVELEVPDGMIPVEEIEAEVNRLANIPIYQEDLTRAMAAHFPQADVKVTGTHGAVAVESLARV